jgi:hypothetical protein
MQRNLKILIIKTIIAFLVSTPIKFSAEHVGLQSPVISIRFSKVSLTSGVSRQSSDYSSSQEQCRCRMLEGLRFCESSNGLTQQAATPGAADRDFSPAMGKCHLHHYAYDKCQGVCQEMRTLPRKQDAKKSRGPGLPG